MKNSTLLSDIAFFRTYSAIKPDGYKESWQEVCDRYEKFLTETYPTLQPSITFSVNYVRKKHVVPSMRALQFAGPGLHRENLRAYNCSAANITSFKDIADGLYLLLCGCGFGYSVKRQHTEQLPEVGPGEGKEYLIFDSREGWCDSVTALLQNPQIVFDYSVIRPAGAIVSTGGTASGPEPLRVAHEHIRAILKGAVGRKLKPVEVSDIVCHLADCVVVGGVRRSALICLFDPDDQEMLTYKSGAWWEKSAQRGRANVSAHILRKGADKEQFESIVDACFASNAGEPGVVWTDNPNMVTNPCVPAGTQILTREGYKNIESLVGKKVDVWNGFEWSPVTPAITGYNQPLVKVTLSSGQSLVCTTAHKWVLALGERVEAVQLNIGDSLLVTEMPTDTPVDRFVSHIPTSVESVEPAGVADVVYCFTESKRNLGCFEGIVTGQCAEIALQDGGLCNLTEINFSTVIDSFDFTQRAWAATFLGTLQAGLTKFNYVSPKWTQNAREEALLGVSLTGLAHNWRLADKFIVEDVFSCVAEKMKVWNAEVANAIGINPAARIGCVKPSGTVSTVLGTTSGIHAAHSPYYLRRIRIDRNSPVGLYLQKELTGTEFLEDDAFVPSNVIVSVPYAMEGAVMREEEPAVRFMNRCAKIYEHWIVPSHRSGGNCHNVSATVTYKDNEKEYVKKWMWQNRDKYSGMSLLPLDVGTYIQAPFETITKERYDELIEKLPNIDLGEVYYGTETKDERQGEAACSSGGCEIT